MTGELVSGADLAKRPLAAANTAVPLPDEPFSRLWQHLTVLRERRGDGHVALLTATGLTPVESLELYAAWQDRVSARFLKGSRMWDDAAWAAGPERLQQRGWFDEDGSLTEAGRT